MIEEGGEFDHLPLDLIELALIQHLTGHHHTPLSRLLNSKLKVDSSEWVNFLVRSHYILHSIDEYIDDPNQE